MAERWETLRDSAAGTQADWFGSERPCRGMSCRSVARLPLVLSWAHRKPVGTSSVRCVSQRHNHCCPSHTESSTVDDADDVCGTPRTRAEAGQGPLSGVVGAEAPLESGFVVVKVDRLLRGM
jgi:hypothetical protein